MNTTLKSLLSHQLPDVESFTVTISEIDLSDQKSCEWTYSEKSPSKLEIYTKLRHDRFTMITGEFDLLSPVRKTFYKKLTQSDGSLKAYQYENGAVNRSFRCELKLKSTIATQPQSESP